VAILKTAMPAIHVSDSRRPSTSRRRNVATFGQRISGAAVEMLAVGGDDGAVGSAARWPDMNSQALARFRVVVVGRREVLTANGAQKITWSVG
jgi:hypothetical protein